MKTYELTIMVTEACNASCTFCTQKHNATTMTSTRIKEIVQDFKIEHPTEEYILAFFGGEPLMNFDIIEEFLLDFKDEYCVQKKITTNGILLTSKIYLFCLKHNIKIGLSYDGIFQNQRKYILSDDVHEIIRKDDNIITVNFGIFKNSRRMLEQYQQLVTEFNLSPQHINFYFNRNYWEWTSKDVHDFAFGFINLVQYLKKNSIPVPNRIRSYLNLITSSDISSGCGAGETHFSYTSDGKRSCGIMDLGQSPKEVPSSKMIEELCSGCSIKDKCPRTCPLVLEQSIKEGLGQNNAQCQLHKIIVLGLEKYYI